MTIYAMTGHRSVNPVRLALRLEAAFKDLKPTAFIQGMAEGADMLSGKLAIDMGIPLICALPWTTHYSSISPKYRGLYKYLLNHAEEAYPVVEAETFPGNWCYHERNRWMVDEADGVIAWYDGRKGGGTAETVKYAKKIGKVVHNIYGEN